MKKFRVFLLVIIVLFLGTIAAFSVPDSCLTLIYPNFGDNYNPDGICKDTCKDSPTYGQWFQSGTWIIGFNQYIFRDSIEIGTIAFIGNIDSVKFPDSYSAIKLIEQKFGKITFHRDPDICNNRFDEAFYEEPCLAVFFEEYCNSVEVNNNLNKIPDIRFIRLRNVPHGTDVIEETHNDCIQINENNEILKIKLNCESINSKDLSIFNILGEHIDKLSDQLNSNSSIGNEINIDISYLPTGIYFLKIGDKFEKFVKM